MKNKLFIYALLPLMGVALFEAPAALAFGPFGGFDTAASPDQIASRTQAMFQSEATLLGLSVDLVKIGWAQGKSIMQIAQDHNITKDQLQQKMQDSRLQGMKTQMQALVDKGIISQAQADQRLASLQNAKGRMGRMRFHRGFGF